MVKDINMQMDDIDLEFARIFKPVGEIHGMDTASIDIFYMVYLSPLEVSLEEIATKTGYSLASVSNKVKMFEMKGMIKKATKPGSKKVYVYADKNFLKLIKNMMVAKSLLVTDIVSTKLPDMIDKYSKKKLNEEQRKKLAIIQDFQRQMDGASCVLKKMAADFEKKIHDCER